MALGRDVQIADIGIYCNRHYDCDLGVGDAELETT